MCGRHQFQVAQSDRIAVGYCDDVDPFEAAVLPLGCGLPGDVQRRSGGMGQLACAADKVGVDVGLDNPCELKPALGEVIEVHVDIAKGIDDQGLTTLGGANDKGGLCEAIFVDLTKIGHGVSGSVRHWRRSDESTGPKYVHRRRAA